MSLPTFGQLLAEFMSRSGISDSELARSIGVRRQTIFRWKEGLSQRPRSREDVLQCAKKLRLSDDERDRLLLAAGFAPEQLTPTLLVPQSPDKHPASPAEQPPVLPTPTVDADVDAEPSMSAPPSDNISSGDTAPSDTAPGDTAPGDTASGDTAPVVEDAALSPLLVSALADSPVDSTLRLGSSPLLPLTKESTAVVDAPPPDTLVATPAAPVLSLLRRVQRWLPVGGILILVALLAFLWTQRTSLVTGPTPTPPVLTLYPPPQTTPTSLVAEQRAAEGENLLLIAQFKGYTRDNTYNVAGRISEELTEQISAVGLISTTVATWSHEITNTMSARQLLMAANATLVIWGEYDSGRVRVNLEARDAKASQSQDFALTTSNELTTIVNDIVPKSIRDTALFVLGNLATYRGKYEIEIARKLSELGNVAAAATLFQQALARGPTDPKTVAKLNFYLGYVTAKGETLSDYARAIAYYTDAYTLNKQFYNALYNRGTIQIKRAQQAPANEAFIVASLNGAIADLTAFIALRPDDANGYFNRGVAYYERDEADDMAAAIADFDQVIALNADYALAYFHRGLAHIRAGQGTQWVADFAQMQLFDPNDIRPISGLCWGYVVAQQAAKALTYCDQAVQHDTSGFSHDSRGIAYAQLGRYAEAIADFRVYLATLKAQGAMPFFERNRGLLVEQWITQLEADQNPFDTVLLEKLRHRDHY